MPRARKVCGDGRKALGPGWGNGRMTLRAHGAAAAVTALTHAHIDIHGQAETPDTGGASAPKEAPATTPVVTSPVAAPVAQPGHSIAAGGLLIRDVHDSWSTLREAIVGGTTEIDVSGVRMIDIAGVQLLLVLAMEARRREQPLRLSGTCTALDEAVRCLGLQSAFESVRELASS